MAIVEVFTCPSVKHWHVHHLNSGKYIIEILTWPSLKNWHAYLWINLIWKEGADLLKFCLDLTDYLLTCPSFRYCLLLKYAHHLICIIEHMPVVEVLTCLSLNLSTDLHYWSTDMPIIEIHVLTCPSLKNWHAYLWITLIWKEGADVLKFCIDLMDYLPTCPSFRYFPLLNIIEKLIYPSFKYLHWSIDMPVI